MRAYLLSLCLLSLCAADVAAQCVASTPIQPTIAPGKCKPGYIYDPNIDRCKDARYILEDTQYTVGNELVEVHLRDEHGNLMLVYMMDPNTGKKVEQLATFWNYDSYGRPGAYRQRDADEVKLEWPADGGCQYSAMTTRGWTSRFTWAGPERVETINTPMDTRKGLYSFNWYPDGNLHISSSAISLYVPVAQVVTTTAYSEDGAQIGYSRKFEDIPPTTSAATAPDTSAATAPAAPRAPFPAVAPPPLKTDPFMQPKVSVQPGAGGPLGVRLLGPMSLLYPSFDYLGRQIARFYSNMAAVVDDNNERAIKCHDAMEHEAKACAKSVDEKYRPDVREPMQWTPDAETDLRGCQASVRERYLACMNGTQLPPLRLPLPPGKSAAKQHCENLAWKQYLIDQQSCDYAYPEQGYEWGACVRRASEKWQRADFLCRDK